MRTQLICLALAIVLLCPFAVTQWVQVGGGSRATSFVAIGSTVFAGTAGAGVFYSTDDGCHWLQTASSPADLNIQSLSAMDTKLFAITSDLGVFSTSDGGQHWISANNGLPTTSGRYYMGREIAVFGRDLFVSVGSNFYRSTDQGGHWAATGSGLPNTTTCFRAFGTVLFAGVTSGWNPKCGLFLSRDSGTSWVDANNGMRDQYGNGPNISCCVAKDSYLFVSTSWGVFRSTDSGNTWTGANNGLPTKNSFVDQVNCLAVSGTNLLAGTRSGGIFLSADNGASWTASDSGLMGKDVSSLFVGAGNFLAGTGCGVFYSPKNNPKWAVAQGLGTLLGGTVQSFLVREAELLVGVSRSLAGNIFRSTDNGNSWTALATFSPRAFATVGTDLFGGYDRGVLRSTDNGQTWNMQRAGLPWVDDSSYVYVSCLASDGMNLFAGVDDGVYWSADKGVTWHPRNTGLENQSIEDLLVSGTKLCACTSTGEVFRSTDAGAKWVSLRSGLPGWGPGEEGIRCLVSVGEDVLAGGNGLYRLTGNDTTWVRINWPGGSYDSAITCLAVHGTTIFAGTHSCGAFVSTDQGTTWKEINEGLLGHDSTEQFGGVLCLAADDKYLYSSPGWLGSRGWQGVGLWRRPLSEVVTTVRSYERDIPAGFSLGPNYPNPFNPSTTIRYGLPNRSHVSLTVFNNLGQSVSTLVNGEQDAGYREVKFDASKLASGVYFYRIEAGSFVQTRKLVLLR